MALERAVDVVALRQPREGEARGRQRGQEGEELVLARVAVLADREQAAADPRRLGERGRHVERVLERVEAGHDVEGAVRPRELLHERDLEVAVRYALAR